TGEGAPGAHPSPGDYQEVVVGTDERTAEPRRPCKQQLIIHLRRSVLLRSQHVYPSLAQPDGNRPGDVLVHVECEAQGSAPLSRSFCRIKGVSSCCFRSSSTFRSRSSMSRSISGLWS